jgi:hypothetical protein
LLLRFFRLGERTRTQQAGKQERDEREHERLESWSVV